MTRWRPIIFAAHDVRAILEGRKTQARRLAKFNSSMHLKEPNGHRRWHRDDGNSHLACPFGQPGERLWVRESFQPTLRDGVPDRGGDYGTGEGYEISYPATDGRIEFIDLHLDELSDRIRPPMHMPRWASRITLEVTGVRVERLQAISEADAISEGVRATRLPLAGPDGVTVWHMEDYPTPDCSDKDARDAFAGDWSRRHGPDSWDENPWVWVIGFRRLPHGDGA